MKRLQQSVLILLGCFLLSSGHQAGSRHRDAQTRSRPVTAREIAREYLPGVVLINCNDAKGHEKLGSGFFVDEGTIVTNHHVIEGMVRGTATTILPNKQQQCG